MTVDANVSSRINLMRILLISGIVFVHIPFDPQTSPYNGDNSFIDWMRVFLGESLFRVGVPCLSAISGYLLFRKGPGSLDYGKILQSKTQTIALPFLLWNGAFFLLVVAMQSQGIGIGYLPDIASSGPVDLLNLTLAAGDTPINLPLYFLRDLFVCIILSPLLAVAIRKYPFPILAALLVLAVLPIPLGIILRNSILFSFSFGIYLGLNQIDLKSIDRYAVPIATGFLAMSAILATALYRTGPDFPMWLDLLRNLMIIAGIPGFWSISALLIRSPAGIRFSKTGGLSFWIFCAHYPLLLLFWMIWNRAGSTQYLVFYACAAMLSFAILIAINSVARQAFPAFYRVLTGSRTPKNATQADHGGLMAAVGVDVARTQSERKPRR